MSAATAVPAHRRHDISGQVWEILEPLLPGGKGKTGRTLTITASFQCCALDLASTGTDRRFCR